MSEQIAIRYDFQVGEKASFTKTITESDIYTYAGLSGDFNPVHVNAEFAQKTRFKERIAHGMLTAGLISAVLGMKLPGPGAIYLSQQMEFLKPVRIGDTITATAEVQSYNADKRILTLRTSCANQRGEAVVEGRAVVMMDQPRT
jgi:3-hydroxybutyryl-CoA dehydratase